MSYHLDPEILVSEIDLPSSLNTWLIQSYGLNAERLSNDSEIFSSG